MNDNKVKIACVGDSITYGHGLKGRENNSYPSQLQKMLGDNFKVGNFGTNHATVFKQGSRPHWKMQSFEKSKEFLPNVVVIILGANCSNNTNWKHNDEYESDYIDLITTYESLPTKPKVYICLPPPAFMRKFGVNPTRITQDIIPRLKKLIKHKKINAIDLYKPFLAQLNYFPDAVHPNTDGAEVIAKRIHFSLINGL